ncbi:peroxidase [Methylobacterium planeticum]|uniref:Peroxidase n=2 Tax=Methylobacterium planeticum TaxID=2615211 RepID=A0A6N6MU22_9HYPH|nr:peroxidase [Methylobacterium planeticum]
MTLSLSRIQAWHRWPFLIAVPMVVGHRTIMRRLNLTDTQTVPPPTALPPEFDMRGARTADGSFNDLGTPWMGMAGARFGRNMPLDRTFGETPPTLFAPSPRLISNRLLARGDFVEVPHLNVLAAAWIQFMIHDWLSHESGDRCAAPHEIPLPQGDDWPEGRMTVLPTRPDRRSAADAGRPAAYANTETGWWDGSQIYGSSLERQRAVRTDPATGRVLSDGKLGLTADGLLPLAHRTARGKADRNLELAGVNGNWWIGLSVMHTLFAREHNAIVDHLRDAYPDACGEWLFQKARLVNAALTAKIHTVEWTPALMNSPEGRMVMRGNFWGLLGEHYARAFGRVGTGEILSGIPGSPTEHHAAPYAMTEEFAAVYRMHSLMPDVFSFRHHADDAEILRRDLAKVAGGQAREIHERVAFADVVYSLATSKPGALVLHNYPNGLRRLDRLDANGVYLDMAAVDILRDRERGVPRYCAFRRHINAHVPRTFAELTDDVTWQKELDEVYGGNIEAVDLLVGTLAESRSVRYGTPPAFGFSDTAFRIFILMASRRLKSDRFYTEDFRPEIYTPAGFAWIQDNALRSVMERHCPALRPHFADARNLFFPWAKGAGAGEARTGAASERSSRGGAPWTKP